MFIFYANVFISTIYCWSYTYLFHAGIVKTQWSAYYKYNIPESQTIQMKVKYNVKTEFYLPKGTVVMY